MTYKKKLIEVALPLEAINIASAREKSIRHGHPSTLHLWWARRPLAAARAVIFAQMVDDPSSHPDIFPTEIDQENERQRLFHIIEELVQWENTTNETVIQQARDEIWKSWRYTCAENDDHPRAKELFDRFNLPAFYDPFAGGGSIPLEAQRLGLKSFASDLNPVAVLINKAMIEIPPKFVGKPPINPSSRRERTFIARKWYGLQGLAEDVLYYGRWMQEEAEKRMGNLYPKIRVDEVLSKDRPDLKRYIGQSLPVIAWIWVRTIKSPNPAFTNVDVPLAGSFSLCAKRGKEAYIDPIIRSDGSGYDFKVRIDGLPRIEGTVDRNGGYCLMSGVSIPFEYIRNEAKAGRMGQRLAAIVSEVDGKKIYLSPTGIHEEVVRNIINTDGPEGNIPDQALGIRVQLYGINQYSALFNNRQKQMLQTFTQLIVELGSVVAGEQDISKEYLQAIQTYLALSVGRYADYGSTMTYWDDRGPSIQKTFGLPTLQMRWSYPETNPFSNFSGNFYGMVEGAAKVLESIPVGVPGECWQADATTSAKVKNVIVSTDPPYYDNIGYAALSDYFYIWLKLSLRSIYPELFATILTPKEAELIAEPGRHGGREGAEHFFYEHFEMFARELIKYSHPSFPTTIYYAFKQAELEKEGGIIASTGWEVFLDGLIRQKWEILGTWPIRTEQSGGLRLVGRNSLASSIILVCRPRDENAPIVTRREFVTALKSELPKAVAHLQAGNIAPVDLAQASIGPGMAVFSRHSKVLDAQGKPLSVRQALSLINQILDEVLTQQEGDFDADTRWALAWFEQFGFLESDYGMAETLSKAKDTSVEGMVEAGILASGRGKVRLLKPTELPDDWNPTTDKRLTSWEMVHQLIRILVRDGESGAAQLIAILGTKAETARELCYRLYTLCERKKWATEALSYNALVQSWPEITRLAKVMTSRPPAQGELF